jgi:hypothetical protein
MSKTGQNTGISKTVKKVIKNDVQTALKQECQNLNSGSFRAKGLKKKLQSEKISAVAKSTEAVN